MCEGGVGLIYLHIIGILLQAYHPRCVLGGRVVVSHRTAIYALWWADSRFPLSAGKRGLRRMMSTPLRLLPMAVVHFRPGYKTLWAAVSKLPAGRGLKQHLKDSGLLPISQHCLSDASVVRFETAIQLCLYPGCRSCRGTHSHRSNASPCPLPHTL